MIQKQPKTRMIGSGERMKRPNEYRKRTFVFSTATLLAGAMLLAGMAKSDPVVVEHDLDDIDEISLIQAARAPAKKQAQLEEKPPARYVTLTIGGDLGFGGSQQPVAAGAGLRHGRRHSFSAMTQGLAPLLKSDLAFANLESVVTDSNRLSAVDKAFNFRMHPAGVRHLVKAGFNILSTANNHAIDYGTTGISHTIQHLSELQGTGLLGLHGVAASEQGMFTPARFARRGASFAFAAAGIGGVRATAKSPGQIHFGAKSDFDRLMSALSDAAVDYRMLSVHYGQELQVRPDAASRNKLAAVAVASRQIDLVVGHHAHTVAGVQRVGRGLVFYGMGNLLHLGMQDMGKFDECRDFGLVARLHLVADENVGGRLIAQAVEIYALDDMHIASRVRKGRDGQKRVEVVNYLSAELTDDHGAGLSFYPRGYGSGLYCAPGASKLAGPVGELCKAWRAPAVPGQARQGQLRRACRYMRKDNSKAEKTAKLRGTMAPRKKSTGLRPFARAAFEPNN
jgi:poly-gamma-glutamate synthesis protein (capsule biosynthesis protein)